MRWAIVILSVLAVVPAFAGMDRLPVISPDVTVRAQVYVPKGGWPTRIGALAPVGGLTLSSYDPAFGGFSAMALRDGAATLLSDGGNWVRIAIRAGRLRTLGAGDLRYGPGTGWDKVTRDTESIVLDGRHAWVGFETANAIWRYSADFRRVEAARAPKQMHFWPINGGAEAMARDGDDFIVFSEVGRFRGRPGTRDALVFRGDPTDARTPVTRFGFRPPRGFSPSDVAVLPDGDLLVLARRWQRWRFEGKLVRIERAAIRPERLVAGRVIATLAAPVLSENAEGVAVTREGAATMIWIVTDNDNWWLRPTYLLKFRLLDGEAGR